MNRSSQEVLDRALALYISDREGPEPAAKIDEAKRLLETLRGNEPAPHCSLMWARVRRVLPFAPDVGELALVEVPNNCTIHSADAQRLLRIVYLSHQIGACWRDQEGVNASLLEELASVTAPPAGDKD